MPVDLMCQTEHHIIEPSDAARGAQGQTRPSSLRATTIIVRRRGARGQTRPSSLRELCGCGAFSVQLDFGAFLTASPRARMEGDGARGRALRHQSPGRAPRATPPPKNISFPTRIHSPAEVSRPSVLLSVASLFPARARLLPKAVSAARLCERLRRRRSLGLGLGLGGGQAVAAACSQISSLASSCSLRAPPQSLRARKWSRFSLPVLRRRRRRGQRHPMPLLFGRGAYGPCPPAPPSSPPALPSGAPAEPRIGWCGGGRPRKMRKA